MLRKTIAEFAGTFLLVFCGTGAIVINDSSNGAITHPGIAAVFGLVVFALIAGFAPVSGAHLNPAVSITFWIRKQLPMQMTALYLLAQTAGAVCASLLLHLLFPLHEKLGSTLPAGTEMQSFVFEFLLTFFLMLTILLTAERKMPLVVIAAAVGAVVGLEALFAGPVCGASMNPARSFGPAIISGNLHSLWLYILAPIAGAAAASFFHNFISSSESK